MTRGGKEYCLSKDRDVAEIQQDMHAIIEDLSRAFVIHGDMKPNNIVRAPADTQRCTRHNSVHNWNFIDFPWVAIEDTEFQNTQDRNRRQKMITTLNLLCNDCGFNSR